jgi:hypothetical protein
MENSELDQEFKQNYSPEKQTPEQDKAAAQWEVIHRLAENNDVTQLAKSYDQLKNLSEAL